MSSVQIPCEWSCTPSRAGPGGRRRTPAERSRIRACAGRTGSRASGRAARPGTSASGRRNPGLGASRTSSGPTPQGDLLVTAVRLEVRGQRRGELHQLGIEEGRARLEGGGHRRYAHLHEQVVGKVGRRRACGEARLGARVPPWARHDLRRDGAADDLAVLQLAVSRAGALVESTRARTNADVSPGRLARLPSSARHGCSATGSIATQSAAMGHRAPPSAIGPRAPRGSPSPRFVSPVLRRDGQRRGDRSGRAHSRTVGHSAR